MLLNDKNIPFSLFPPALDIPGNLDTPNPGMVGVVMGIRTDVVDVDDVIVVVGVVVVTVVGLVTRIGFRFGVVFVVCA